MSHGDPMSMVCERMVIHRLFPHQIAGPSADAEKGAQLLPLP